MNLLTSQQVESIIWNTSFTNRIISLWTSMNACWDLFKRISPGHSKHIWKLFNSSLPRNTWKRSWSTPETFQLNPNPTLSKFMFCPNLYSISIGFIYMDKHDIWNCMLKVWKFIWTIKGLQKFKKKTQIMTGISHLSKQAQIQCQCLKLGLKNTGTWGLIETLLYAVTLSKLKIILTNEHKILLPKMMRTFSWLLFLSNIKSGKIIHNTK